MQSPQNVQKPMDLGKICFPHTHLRCVTSAFVSELHFYTIMPPKLPNNITQVFSITMMEAQAQ